MRYSATALQFEIGSSIFQNEILYLYIFIYINIYRYNLLFMVLVNIKTNCSAVADYSVAMQQNLISQQVA